MSTEHFTDEELACGCGCGGLPPQPFQDELEALRSIYEAPLQLNSAYRCPDHNDAVSSTGRGGPHTLGAVDVSILGGDAVELIRLAATMGWTGFGVSQNTAHASRFLHLDRLPNAPGRPRPWLWSY